MTFFNDFGIRTVIMYFPSRLMIRLKDTKITKIFVPVILFYGNNNVCFGVCEMGLMCIDTFKNFC